MNKLCISVLLAAVVLTSCNKKQSVTDYSEIEDPPTPPSFTVKFVIGEALIITPESESRAITGSTLGISDTIKTKEKSTVDIAYETSGIIRVSENSTLTIKELIGSSSKETSLTLPEGKITVTLSKLKEGKFKVTTPTMVAAVRGTTFMVQTSDKASQLTVLNGTVEAALSPSEAGGSDIKVTTALGEKVTINTKDIPKLVNKEKKLNAVKMKRAELVQAQTELKSIQDSNSELDTSVKKELSVVSPNAIQLSIDKIDKTAEMKDTSDEDAKRRAEEERRLRKEEEARRRAEEKKRRIEDAKENAITAPPI
ncbi:MAG: FecR family protein [Spirochaetes bacterium]|jgi:hypothetical protein|nr:FecR family protein [Spirochaetota bacterium]